MGYFYAYGIISALVSAGTIRKWKKQEDLRMSVPVGDEEYYEFDSDYGLINALFFPSMLICGAYKKVCEIANRESKPKKTKLDETTNKFESYEEPAKKTTVREYDSDNFNKTSMF